MGQGVHVHQTVKLQIHVWCLNIISICFKSICKNLTFRESTDNIERPCLDIEAAEKLWKAQQRKQRRNPVIEETPKSRLPPQYGAWYLRPGTWSKYHHRNQAQAGKIVDTGDSEKKNKAPSTTVKAFDKYLSDSNLYPKTTTIKNLLY